MIDIIIVSIIPPPPPLSLSSGEEASQLMSCLFQFAVASPVNCGQELKQLLSSLTSHIAV